MTLSEGARDIAAWPRRRLGLALVATIVFVVVAVAASGLPPFGVAPGAAWRYPLLVLLAAAVGLYAATAVQSPVGAEMTLCDLRWPALAAAGTIYAGQGAMSSSGLVALFGIAAVALMVWAVVQRLDQERAALHDENGQACLTCRPLFARTVRSDAPAAESASTETADPPARLADAADAGGAGDATSWTTKTPA